MESRAPSNRPALMKRALSSQLSRCFSRPPQDEEAPPEIARPPPIDAAEISNPMTMKPRIRDIFYTMELYVLFLKVMQLYQLNLEDFDHVPLGPPINQHGHRVRQMKKIYDELKNAKAIAGQSEFDQKLIETVRHIQWFLAEFDQNLSETVRQGIQRFLAEHDQRPPAEFDQNLIETVRQGILRFLAEQGIQRFLAERDQHRPAEFDQDLIETVRQGIQRPPAEFDQYLIETVRQGIQRFLAEHDQRPPAEFDQKLIETVRQDIQRILGEHDQRPPAGFNDVVDYIVDLLPDELRRPPNEWHAVRITQLKCSPKAEPCIDGMDSFEDIRNQVAAMYQHSLQSERRTDDIYTWCGSFHKDISNGNCEAVENFLQRNPLALTSKITVDGNTPLHVAVKAKKLSIVNLLLARLTVVETMLVETLKKPNKAGKTALYIAASSGYRDIAAELVRRNWDALFIELRQDGAAELVRRNRHALFIECQDGADHLLPLFVAAKYDNKETVECIYNAMRRYGRMEIHRENQRNQKAKERLKQWALFLANLIYNDDYGMALRIIQDYPSLALSKYTDVETPLFALAQRPSLGANVTFHNEASKFSCPTFICGNNIDDGAASNASELLERIMFTIDDLEFHKPALSTALFKAVEVGSVEFVAIFTNFLPLAFSWLNDLHQNIFHVAIIHRQEKIFNLIYGLGSVKNDLTGSADKSNNWMLHFAGEMAPANRLNQVPGPAMQLQRELQWFQAVRGIVPNISIDIKNLGENTPHELFAEKHKDLMKDGVKWMRNTASSCSIVAALITTVMFAAAFTLPGGNNLYTGDPMFLGHISFKIFVGADLVALSTSSISVLIFLSILTSRFAQEDFVKSLPMRLMWGLVFLFFSMVAMMAAFCDAIYIIFQKEYYWYWILIAVPVIGLLTVIMFLIMMFPLLITLWRATNNSIFNKSSRHMYY